MAKSKNPFKSGERKVIPAVLIYARREKKFLMIQKKGSGLWNGLGGKCELDESPLEAAVREFKEESGVSLPPDTFRSLGVLQFPNFKPKRSEDWIVFVFQVDYPSSAPEPHPSCDEGTLHWMEQDQLGTLKMWAGDQIFLTYVKDGSPFMGTLWYENETLARHWMQTLI